MHFLIRNFSFKKISFFLLMVLISFKILTPPTTNVIIKSPNLKYEARLKTFYYFEDKRPSYKVYFREKNRLIWKNLIYIPNNLDSSEIMIRWSSDSLSLNLLSENKVINNLKIPQ